MSKPHRNNPEWDDSDDISEAIRRKTFARRERTREDRQHGFGCDHCKVWVAIHEQSGTHQRNHCPSCLWSKHVDDEKPGDRKSECRSGMEPVALTFKGEPVGRYDLEGSRIGELMLVHECVQEDQIRINRIAADDDPNAIMRVHESSLYMPPVRRMRIEAAGIAIAGADIDVIVQQLFGLRGD